MPDGTKKRVAVPALDGDVSFDPTRYTAHVAQTPSETPLSLGTAHVTQTTSTRDSDASLDLAAAEPVEDRGGGKHADARDDSQARVDGGGGGRRRHVLLQDPVVPPALCTSGPGHPGVCVTMQAPQVCVCVCVCVCVYT